MIDLSGQRISADVLFDELTQIRVQMSNYIVPVASERRNVKEFTYLIGMIYRDDESKLLYVTKRVVVQRAEIVCFVCAYLHNVVDQEEPHPIRVADVERMLHAYLLDNSPESVLLDDYYMPAFDCNSTTDNAFLVGDASVREEELEKWKKLILLRSSLLYVTIMCGMSASLLMTQTC